MVFLLSAMKPPIPHLAKRPTLCITPSLSCIHTLLKRYASSSSSSSFYSQDQPPRRGRGGDKPFVNHNSSYNSRQTDHNNHHRQNTSRQHQHQHQQHNTSYKNHTSRRNDSGGEDGGQQRSVARYTHQPRQRWMNVNPSRASITVYKHNLLAVQYCSAVLLLRTHGILLNPFHPLLRTALQRHQETYDIGYFFHLHTSSKLVTGKQSSVRKGIRGKVRAAWEQVLTNRGYDVKTGRFVRHLKPGFDRSLGHVVLPDIKGTVSINPNEVCSNAPFQDIITACENGLDAVLRCKHRNMTLEEWMKPENLWRFYDWRRRDLLNKYMHLAGGLGSNSQTSQIFKSALIGLRTGKTDIKMKGTRTPEGGYLVDLDGETYDIAPLRGPALKDRGLEQEEFNDEDAKLFQEAFEKGDPDMEGLFAGMDDGDGIGSGDLDWGLDDIEPEDNEAQFGKGSKSGKRLADSKQYLDNF